MFVGNFKSRDDEKMKRMTQLNLLKVMAENEEELERRVKDYRNPYAPPPLPPVFKTAGQRREEAVENEKLAIDNLRSIVDFNTNDLSNIISNLRTSGIPDAVFTFNSFFPQIKTRILRTLNPKLVDAKFLSKYIIDYLRDAGRINPLRFTEEGIMVSSNYADLMGIYAFSDDIENFKIKYNELKEYLTERVEPTASRKGQELEADALILADITELYLDDDDINVYRAQFTQRELEIATQRIQRYYTKNQLMDKELLMKFQKDIDEAIRNNKLSKAVKVANDIIKRLKSINIAKTKKSLDNLYADFDKIINTENEEGLEDLLDNETLATERPSSALPPADKGEGGLSSGDALSSFATGGVAESKGGDEDEVSEMTESRSGELSRSIGEYAQSIVEDLSDAEKLEMIEQIKELYKSVPIPLKARLNGLSKNMGYKNFNDALSKATTPNSVIIILQMIVEAKQIDYPTYDPFSEPPNLGAEKMVFKSSKIPNYKGKKGFGMVKNHRVMRPAVMPPSRPVAGRKQMKIDELEFAKNLEKAKGRRGNPKAITGKGVVIEMPEETYKTFGKHIVHYPQLRDTNTLNIKYPSKSKNYVPKISISGHYKDLMMDLLERGKYSDTLLEKLDDDEKEHFHKIVKGAGLLEQFKLKTPTNDKMKQAKERFKVLRGNFLAGNNSPTLLKELKELIIVFMEKEVISKEDGYDLLRELT